MAATRNNFVKQTNVRRFRPPLKSSQDSITNSSPLVSVNKFIGQQGTTASTPPLPTSQQNDSLPDSQTHTVLSYCDNYQQSPASPPHLSPSTAADNSEEEDEPQELHTRFTAHKVESHPPRRLYEYHPLSNRKRTMVDINRRTAAEGSKRVRITSPPVLSRERDCDSHDLIKDGCGYDLSVFDYSPTPVQEGEGLKEEVKKKGKQKTNESSVSVCGYAGSIQEQYAIDCEVIETIRKTRAEIQSIRNKYASRATELTGRKKKGLYEQAHLPKHSSVCVAIMNHEP